MVGVDENLYNYVYLIYKETNHLVRLVININTHMTFNGP